MTASNLMQKLKRQTLLIPLAMNHGNLEIVSFLFKVRNKLEVFPLLPKERNIKAAEFIQQNQRQKIS